VPVRIASRSSASTRPEASAPSSAFLLPSFSPQASAVSVAASAEPAQVSQPQEGVCAPAAEPAWSPQEEACARPAEEFAGAQPVQAESCSAQAE